MGYPNRKFYLLKNSKQKEKGTLHRLKEEFLSFALASASIETGTLHGKNKNGIY